MKGSLPGFSSSPQGSDRVLSQASLSTFWSRPALLTESLGMSAFIPIPGALHVPFPSPEQPSPLFTASCGVVLLHLTENTTKLAYKEKKVRTEFQHHCDHRPGRAWGPNAAFGAVGHL